VLYSIYDGLWEGERAQLLPALDPCNSQLSRRLINCAGSAMCRHQDVPIHVHAYIVCMLLRLSQLSTNPQLLLWVHTWRCREWLMLLMLWCNVAAAAADALLQDFVKHPKVLQLLHNGELLQVGGRKHCSVSQYWGGCWDGPGSAAGNGRAGLSVTLVHVPGEDR
jgi:hypothetical protein